MKSSLNRWESLCVCLQHVLMSRQLVWLILTTIKELWMKVIHNFILPIATQLSSLLECSEFSDEDEIYFFFHNRSIASIRRLPHIHHVFSGAKMMMILRCFVRGKMRAEKKFNSFWSIFSVCLFVVVQVTRTLDDSLS